MKRVANPVGLANDGHVPEHVHRRSENEVAIMRHVIAQQERILEGMRMQLRAAERRLHAGRN